MENEEQDALATAWWQRLQRFGAQAPNNHGTLATVVISKKARL